MAVGVMVGVRDDVGVREGVGVLLGVKVNVGVGVTEGVRVTVTVCVIGVLVRVGEGVRVGVADSTVAVGEGVRVFTPLSVDAEVTSMETLNSTVRELDATIVRCVKGISLDTIGIYSSRTSTVTR